MTVNVIAPDRMRHAGLAICANAIFQSDFHPPPRDLTNIAKRVTDSTA